VGKKKKHSVNLTGKIVIGEFKVKESVLDTFLLFNTYRLILVGIDRGDSVAGDVL